MRKHYIIKDITDEYIAIVQTKETIYCKNTTKWINEINIEDLDETGDGWTVITADELDDLLNSTRTIAETTSGSSVPRLAVAGLNKTATNGKK